MRKLNELKINECSKVVQIVADLKLKRRLLELGLVQNEEIKILSISPLKNTFLVEIMNYSLAIRKDVAEKILVV